jgi:hypothetical protein
MPINTQTQYGSNRLQMYREMSKGCSMYDPCPINYKCMNKASHLYVRCQECPVPHATHDHKARSWAIRRENYAITVTPETGQKFKELADSVLRSNQNEQES